MIYTCRPLSTHSLQYSKIFKDHFFIISLGITLQIYFKMQFFAHASVQIDNKSSAHDWLS